MQQGVNRGVERLALASTGSANANHEIVSYLVDLPIRGHGLTRIETDAHGLIAIINRPVRIRRIRANPCSIPPTASRL